MEQFNEMQQVKRQFFAMRNGLLADTLRRGVAAPFRIIFGLNLPQITDIARETGHNAELARRLWANNTTRESMLLAPMLLNADDINAGEAEAMAQASPTPEVSDVLCHRLLRHHTSAPGIVDALAAAPEPLHRYTALRLQLNLLSAAPTPEAIARARRLAAAELERGTALTRPVATQLAQEAEWLAE